MATRYTKKQKASKVFDEYKRERARIQSFVSSAKRRGIRFTKDVLPPIPKTITPASVRRLQRITPEHGYYEHAEIEQVDIVTGTITYKSGSQTAISRGLATIKERTREGARYVQFDSKEAEEYFDDLRYRLARTDTDYTYEPRVTEPERPEENDPEDFYSRYADEPSSWDEDDYWDTDFDRISYEEQVDRVNDYIDHAIDYIGHHVSSRWADAMSEIIDSVRASFGDRAFAELMDDEAFWDELSSVVQEYYKSNRKSDPKPMIMSRIQAKISGEPMSMRENTEYNDDVYGEDSEDYEV